MRVPSPKNLRENVISAQKHSQAMVALSQNIFRKLPPTPHAAYQFYNRNCPVQPLHKESQLSRQPLLILSVSIRHSFLPLAFFLFKLGSLAPIFFQSDSFAFHRLGRNTTAINRRLGSIWFERLYSYRSLGRFHCDFFQ